MRYHHRRHQSWVLDEFTVTEPRTFCGCCGAFHFRFGPVIPCTRFDAGRFSLLDRLEPLSSHLRTCRSPLKIAPDKARVNACPSHVVVAARLRSSASVGADTSRSAKAFTSPSSRKPQLPVFQEGGGYPSLVAFRPLRGFRRLALREKFDVRGAPCRGYRPRSLALA